MINISLPTYRVVYHNFSVSQPPELLVLIPARNEECTIRSTLDSWYRQRLTGVSNLTAERPYGLVLVANNCTDRTVSEAVSFGHAHPSFPLSVLSTQLPPQQANVGWARRLAGHWADQFCRATTLPDALLFYSDADTQAAPDLVAQLFQEFSDARVAAVGARLSTGSQPLGTYHRLFIEYHQALQDYRAALYGSAPCHDYFTGAGMGVRLSAYRAVGGIAPLSFNEDKHFRAALEANDLLIRYSDRCVVHTSCRQQGRVSWGMSRQLATWAAAERAGQSLLVTHPGTVRTRAELHRAITTVRTHQDLTEWQRFAAPWWLPTVADRYLREIQEADYTGTALARIWHCPGFVQLRRRRYPHLPVEEATLLLSQSRVRVA